MHESLRTRNRPRTRERFGVSTAPVEVRDVVVPPGIVEGEQRAREERERFVTPRTFRSGVGW